MPYSGSRTYSWYGTLPDGKKLILFPVSASYSERAVLPPNVGTCTCPCFTFSLRLLINGRISTFDFTSPTLSKSVRLSFMITIILAGVVDTVELFFSMFCASSSTFSIEYPSGCSTLKYGISLKRDDTYPCSL